MDKSRGLWTSGRRAVVVGVLTAVILILTTGNIGLTWDEPSYIAASESYNGWFHRLVFGPHGVLNSTVIETYWTTGSEHPPFDKEISGLVWLAARHLMDDLTAHRLANILLVSIAVALLYHLVRDELGEMAGIATVAALLLMPRFFFHAHLAALDVPAASLMVIVTCVFWRTKESARFRYTILLGAVTGLAFATKINAVIILPTLLLWTLLFRRRLYLFARLALAVVVGAAVFVVIWPWLYYDTLHRFTAFITFFTVSHEPIPQYFLHRTVLHPSWQFPLVMILAVVPLGTTILYCLGILRAFLRRRDRAFCALLVLNALVPLIVFMIPPSMIFDDERLLMPAFPFLAALAGAGFAWLTQLLRVLLQRARVPAAAALLSGAAAVLVVAFPLSRMIIYSPHLLSYYSETVGGLPGAVKLGLETTYWSESYREAIDFVNANAKAGDSVWVEPGTYDILVYYQLHGVLRSDVTIAITYDTNPPTVFGTSVPFPVVAVPYSQANFVIVQYHQSYLYDSNGRPMEVAQWMAARTPAFRVQREGVPILDVYTNP
jgi:4-amino-4-deoxy-L-arabinose transferase-like glycosyltransferase